jgi:hypothetical protein
MVHVVEKLKARGMRVRDDAVAPQEQFSPRLFPTSVDFFMFFWGITDLTY